MASPDVDLVDTTTNTPVTEQPVEPSTDAGDQTPEAPAQDTPATDSPSLDTPSNNPDATPAPEDKPSAKDDASAQPTPEADAPAQDESPELEPFVESEASSEADEELTADMLASEKTTTIGKVTYTYQTGSHIWYGEGVNITNTSGGSSITIPAKIEGKDVIMFSTTAGEKSAIRLDASKATSLCVLHASNLLSLKVPASLYELDVPNGGLTELDVSKCENLLYLTCRNNRLTTLDVTKNNRLLSLVVNFNRLTHLDVSNNSGLNNLVCGSNALTELNVSANTELEYLYCYGNMLTNLDVSKNTKLIEFDCDGNRLTKLDVSALKKLKTFYCHHNYITDTKALTDRFGKKENVVLPQISRTMPPRLAGDTALDTMINIIGRGFEKSDTVIVTTMGGYWDALTASSLAGLKDCPILLTDGSTLSSQTSLLVRRLAATNVLIAGGPSAVSTKVETSLKNIAGVKTVQRLAGATAVETALKIYNEGKGSWGTTAVVATSETFQDALSVSPYAYAKDAPIFLANASTHKLDANALSTLKAGGFKHVVIVGGTAALSDQIEKTQLKGISCTRLAGATAYETSTAIAKWCLTQGMTAANVGIATGASYYDALAGAALCGKNNSVLVLVSDGYYSSINSFIAPNKNSIKEAYVFGGPAAVSPKTYNAISAALK